MFKRTKVLSLLALALLLSSLLAGLILSNQVNASSPTLDSTACPSGENLFFYDDFNGSSIDTSKWQVTLNTKMNDNPAYGGSVQLNNSFVELSSNGSTFPWVCTKENPFPTTGDFTVKLDITYSGISDFGNGIMITGGDPLIVSENPSPSTKGIIQLWADNDQSYTRSKMIIYFLGKEVWRSYVQGWEPNSPTVNFELSYVNGTYKLNIDGQQIATTQSDVRPNSIGLGHPPTYYLPFSSEHLSTLIGGWTKFKIDSIKVAALATDLPESTSPTPAVTESCTPQPSTSTGIPQGLTIESNSTVSAFVFDNSGSTPKISFNVSGPEGSTGYVKLTIAKTFMPNSNVTIYLDGNQIQYDLTVNDNSWVVTFNYHHSTHQITINSQDNTIKTTPSLPDWLVNAVLIIITITLLGAIGIIAWLVRQGRTEKQL